MTDDNKPHDPPFDQAFYDEPPMGIRLDAAEHEGPAMSALPEDYPTPQPVCGVGTTLSPTPLDLTDGITVLKSNQTPADIVAAVEEIELPSDVEPIADIDDSWPPVIGTSPAPTPTPDTDTGNPKDRIASKKPDLTLIPPAALLHESKGMMDGEKKYGAYNWRENKVKARVYIAAAMRHLQQLLDGEDFDPISDVHHAGHVRCCMGIYLDAHDSGNLIDDRPKAGPAGNMIRYYEANQTFKGSANVR